jgi:hypothetical protein
LGDVHEFIPPEGLAKWAGRNAEVLEMISQRRGAQLGLVSAALVLVASFGILIVQGRNAAASDSSNSPLNTYSQTQSSVPMAVSLSAPGHSHDSVGQQ